MSRLFSRKGRLGVMGTYFAIASVCFGVEAKDSPFLPAAGAAAPAAVGAAEYELNGMSVVGKDTLLSIVREQDKRSLWIPIGKTVAEITAVSYDADTDSAVIQVNGRPLTVTMRKSAVVFGPPARVPPPTPVVMAPEPVVQTAPARPMTANEEKETEARMLVTDLLEIGQQQRKAYEEAQRQAALRGEGQPSPPAGTPVPANATAPAKP